MREETKCMKILRDVDNKKCYETPRTVNLQNRDLRTHTIDNFSMSSLTGCVPYLGWATLISYHRRALEREIEREQRPREEESLLT
jgi:hypothetical protein